ncbi:hypothetical protein HMPREF3151_08010 [Corynebacterium sp. HMSC05H05]|uniref:DUF1707 SHOCT-like domain-containing protein n=1 Tax=Corynebacterium sp. HMSC05H05 TaxID=1581119 RepID=UPI0008A5E6D6|nr:DUF1707 domain-containing protein [Corynebacterium sp. HMSC05H05]OFT57336.1 hypothetical protein HMPREF3151_08010 [Corynebacterium sp. HMSC05H05]
MDNPTPPRKRASDAERHTAAKHLQEAFADGQLSMSEFDERSRALYAATYADELPALVEDLSPVAHAEREAAPSQTRVSGESGGSSFSLCVMGGTERTGQWLVAPTHTSITLMGGNALDLREARLASRETTIYALSIMGGIDIIVPEDVRVIDDGVGIMGGFGMEDHPSCTLSVAQLPADAPVIRVRGLALMGGVGITRAARGVRVR